MQNIKQEIENISIQINELKSKKIILEKKLMESDSFKEYFDEKASHLPNINNQDVLPSIPLIIKENKRK